MPPGAKLKNTECECWKSRINFVDSKNTSVSLFFFPCSSECWQQILIGCQHLLAYLWISGHSQIYLGLQTFAITYSYIHLHETEWQKSGLPAICILRCDLINSNTEEIKIKDFLHTKLNTTSTFNPVNVTLAIHHYLNLLLMVDMLLIFALCLVVRHLCLLVMFIAAYEQNDCHWMKCEMITLTTVQPL